MSKEGFNGFYRLRWKILKRDNFTCQYCGQSAPSVKLEVDHKIAISAGGTDEESNLVTSCYACNRGKGGLIKSMIRAKAARHFIPQSAEPRIITLLRKYNELRVPEIVEKLGLKDMTVRVKLSIYKRQGIVDNPTPGRWRIKGTQSTPANPQNENKKSVCSTCNDLKYIPVQQDDAIRYKPCPDCHATSKLASK